MASTTTQQTDHALGAKQAERLYGYVARARVAADRFRAVDDQAAVARIVHALVVAGLEHAVELARLAMDDTALACPRTSWSRSGGRKLTLVDYSLVPAMAVVDPRLTLTMPPVLTADTGVDALTHALEAGVSIFASPHTDAFCMQALHLIGLGRGHLAARSAAASHA